MTSNYNRKDASNVQKLIDLMMVTANENEQSYEYMLRMRDVDQATGVHLDMFGENVQLPRGQMNDTLYRQLIKVKILLDRSNGDIPTLNRVFRAFLGDAFNGLQEGWTHTSNEPAALVVKVGEGVDLQWLDFLKQALAGGVGLSASADMPADTMRIITHTQHYGISYPITNMFVTAQYPGRGVKDTVAAQDNTYTYDVLYPVANQFYAG